MNNERATPETDAAEFSILLPDNDNDISAALAVPSDLSRKLERQRDELMEALTALIDRVNRDGTIGYREGPVYNAAALLSRIRHSEG